MENEDQNELEYRSILDAISKKAFIMCRRPRPKLWPNDREFRIQSYTVFLCSEFQNMAKENGTNNLLQTIHDFIIMTDRVSKESGNVFLWAYSEDIIQASDDIMQAIGFHTQQK
jgi:hypothetical protein